MEYFTQQCFPRIKTIVEPLGFKRDKMLFGRIINDVWQSFYIDIINRTKDYAVCRVGFEISPLCRKLEYQWICNTWVLELGEPLGRQQRDYWDYSRTSEESVNSCIDIIIENISARLIPLFEQATDSKMALKALCSVEKKSANRFSRPLILMCTGRMIIINYIWHSKTQTMTLYCTHMK
jgi:hypothetical protein